MFSVVTRNVNETFDLGRSLGSLLRAGDVLGLVGGLGAGKTYFTKGIAVGLGLSDPQVVTSPTFVLLNTYPTRIPIRHYDLYRVQGSELETFGFSDFRDSSVSVVEWADKTDPKLLANHLRVELQMADENSRILSFQPVGDRPKRLLDELRDRVMERRRF